MSTRNVPLTGAGSSARLAAPSSRLALAIAAWAGGVLLLGSLGVLEALGGLRAPPVIVLSIALPVLASFRSRTLRAAIDAISLRGLTAVHLLRFVGAAAILELGSAGRLPPLIAAFSGYGDLIAASVAAVVIALPFARWRYLVAHLVSLADFTASLSVGLVLTVKEDSMMATMVQLPGGFILFFVIGFYSTASIVSLSRLLRRSV